MKATVTFNLPDEQEEYEQYLRGPSYHSALEDFSRVLRAKRKYSETVPESWQEVSDMFYEALTSNGVEL